MGAAGVGWTCNPPFIPTVTCTRPGTGSDVRPAGGSYPPIAVDVSIAQNAPPEITNRATDFFEMSMDVEVKDLRHLTNIIAALRATPSVNSVERARG